VGTVAGTGAQARWGPVELAGEVELMATLPVPDGQKLDPSLGPPVQLSVASNGLLSDGSLLLTSDELPARVRLALGAAEGSLDVLLRVGTCEEGPGAVCNLAERRWRVTRCDAMRRAPRGSTWGSGSFRQPPVGSLPGPPMGLASSASVVSMVFVRLLRG